MTDAARLRDLAAEARAIAKRLVDGKATAVRCGAAWLEDAARLIERERTAAEVRSHAPIMAADGSAIVGCACGAEIDHRPGDDSDESYSSHVAAHVAARVADDSASAVSEPAGTAAKMTIGQRALLASCFKIGFAEIQLRILRGDEDDRVIELVAMFDSYFAELRAILGHDEVPIVSWETREMAKHRAAQLRADAASSLGATASTS